MEYIDNTYSWLGVRPVSFSANPTELPLAYVPVSKFAPAPVTSVPLLTAPIRTAAGFAV